MSVLNSNLRQLKWSLLIFTGSVVLGACAIGLSGAYESAALDAKAAAQTQLGEARMRLAATQSDFENLSTYATEYASLVDRQIIGAEQRLDWMEGLKKRQHQVIDLKYTIAPQQPYLPVPALDTGNLQIKLSGVHLHMDLLHEMQLLHFFEALRSDSKGWFTLDHCTLETAAANAGETPAIRGAQLKADCTGGWITLGNRGTP